jgi:hypothetical protein
MCESYNRVIVGVMRDTHRRIKDLSKLKRHSCLMCKKSEARARCGHKRIRYGDIRMCP